MTYQQSSDKSVKRLIVLCDAALWSRNGGSRILLTEDTEDLSGKDEDTDGAIDGGGVTGENDDRLLKSFEGFLGSEKIRTGAHQRPDRKTPRYGISATDRFYR